MNPCDFARHGATWDKRRPEGIGALFRRGGFGGGGDGAPMVTPGDYLVTVHVGGQTSRQVLRVEDYRGGAAGHEGRRD